MLTEPGHSGFLRKNLKTGPGMCCLTDKLVHVAIDKCCMAGTVLTALLSFFL